MLVYKGFGFVPGSSRDAIVFFCHIINHKGGKMGAFHPNEVLKTIEGLVMDRVLTGRTPPCFSSRRTVTPVIQESYEKALERHIIENPGGPLPRMIKCYYQKSRLSLVWVTSQGTRLVLTMFTSKSKKYLQQSTLEISGRSRNAVVKYLQYADLGSSPITEEVIIPRWLSRDIVMPLGQALVLLK